MTIPDTARWLIIASHALYGDNEIDTAQTDTAAESKLTAYAAAFGNGWTLTAIRINTVHDDEPEKATA